MIVGIDEAGRGALAGPVVASCCFLHPKIQTPAYITDSKKLSFTQRQIAYAWLQENAVFAIGITSNAIIDAKGILYATNKAMQSALRKLQKVLAISHALVDGRDAFTFNVPHTSIIRGDQTEISISAASIIAKVYRDTQMMKYATKFPQYDFAQNKGYGTKNHCAAITEHGQCALHRKTFIHF